MDKTFSKNSFNGEISYQNGKDLESKRVYPLYQVFTDASVSVDEKLQLVTAFKKHVKLKKIDENEFQSYFDAFLFYLDDKKNDTKRLEIITKDHQSKLFPQFEQQLYSTFCHLIARASWQQSINITKDLIKNSMLVFIQNENKNFEMANTKRAIEGMFLAEHELFDNILLNDFLLNKQISNVLKFDILETIKTVILPLTTKDLMLDENDSEILKKHQQYLFKYNFFLQKQLNKDNLDKLRNCLDNKQDNEKLTQWCLEICENYNIPYLNQTKTPAPTNHINTFTPENFNESTSKENSILISQHEIDKSNLQSEKDKENIKPMFDTLETELQRIISSKSNNMFPSLISSSTASASSQPHYTSSFSTTISAKTTTRNFTSLEYFFKELDSSLSAFHLKENESNWKKRQSFILKLRSFLSSATTILNENTHAFVKHFKEMRYIDCIHKAVHSLRTTLSSSACMLIKELCSIFKKNLDLFQEQFFEILKPLLSSTKKLSVNNAHMAILSMLSHCSFNKKVFLASANLSRDKNVQPKICSCDYLRLFIIKSANSFQPSTFHINDETTENSDEFAYQLKSWVKNLITTPQTLVRSYCKIAFWYFYNLHPKMATQLLTDLNPQFKKSVENDIPPYLNIQYPMPSSDIKPNQRESSVSRFKKFKALSQPPAQSAYTTNSPSRREDYNAVKHSLSRNTLRAHSDSSIRKTPKSNNANSSTLEGQNDAMPSTRKTLSREIDIPNTTTKPSLQPASPFVSHTPKTTLYQHHTPKSVLNSYSKKVQEGSSQTTDVSTEDLINVLIEKLQAVSSNSFSNVEQTLDEVVVYLSSHNVDENIKKVKHSELISALRQIALHAPMAFRFVIGKKSFIKLYAENVQYLSHLIELFAINNEFSIKHLLDSLSASIVFHSILTQIFSSEMDTGCQSSLFYVKYRKDILNYGLRSCIKLIELDANKSGENVLASNHEESLSHVIKQWGNYFNEEVYFELLTRFQINNPTAFKDYVLKLPVFQKAKIAKEVQKRNAEFDAYSILGQHLRKTVEDDLTSPENHLESPPLKRKRSLSSSVMDTYEKRFVSNVTDPNADDVLMIDDQTVEKKAMELTMVHPWKPLLAMSKQSSDEPDKRISSTGSVVLHKMQVASAVESEFTQCYGNDTMRLSEMTKIIPAFSTNNKNSLDSKELSKNGKGKVTNLEGKEKEEEEKEEEEKEEEEDVIDLSDLFYGSGAETLSPLKFDIDNFHKEQEPAKQEMQSLSKTQTESESLTDKENLEKISFENDAVTQITDLPLKESASGVQTQDIKQKAQNQAKQPETDETMEEATDLKDEQSAKIVEKKVGPKHNEEMKIETVRDLKSLNKFLGEKNQFEKEIFPTNGALSQMFSAFVVKLIECFKEASYADFAEYAKYTSIMTDWLSKADLQKIALEFLPEIVSTFQVQDYVFDDKHIITMVDTVASLCQTTESYEKLYFSDSCESETLFVMACMQQIVASKNVDIISPSILNNLTDEKLCSTNSGIRVQTYRVIGRLLDDLDYKMSLQPCTLELIKRFK